MFLLPPSTGESQLAAGVDREVPRRSSGVDTPDVVSPLLMGEAGLAGLLLTGDAGLALRSVTLLAGNMSGSGGASPDTVHEHTLADGGGPNCVAAATAAVCCLSHSCNLQS